MPLIQKNAVMSEDFEEFLESELKAYESDESSDNEKEGKKISKITDFDRSRCQKIGQILVRF